MCQQWPPPPALRFKAGKDGDGDGMADGPGLTLKPPGIAGIRRLPQSIQHQGTYRHRVGKFQRERPQVEHFQGDFAMIARIDLGIGNVNHHTVDGKGVRSQPYPAGRGADSNMDRPDLQDIFVSVQSDSFLAGRILISRKRKILFIRSIHV